MSNTFSKRRAGAALSCLAAASMLSVSLAATAMAQSGPLIDTRGDVSLTIHKYEGAPVDGTSSNGTDLFGTPTQGALDAKPVLQGVVFDVYKVGGVDLTTNAGWVAATALQAHPITQAEVAAKKITVGGVDYTLTLAQSVTTLATGQAVFTSPDEALYLVAENLGSSTNVLQHNPGGAAGVPIKASDVTPSKPFLVTLPMTQPQSLDGWMYDVHAYPKNAVDEIIKSVLDKGTVTSNLDGSGAKHAISYSLDSTVTTGYQYKAGDTYVVGDQLDSRFTLTGVKVLVDGTELAATGFKVYVNDVLTTNFSAVPAGAKVEVQLSDETLSTLSGRSGVETVLDGTVGVADVSGLTKIPNTATFVPNAGWWAAQAKTDTPFDPTKDDTTKSQTGSTVTPLTSNEVLSLYGSLKVTKVDASTTSITLKGAEFAVYSSADATCDAADVVPGNLLAPAAATDDNGVVSFNGLQASTYYDGAEQTGALQYCLVETKAAPGYNLLAQPIGFTIGHDGTAMTANAEALTVKNVKSNLGNALPLTGGAGAATLAGGSLLLMAVAGGYVIVRRRQEADVTGEVSS